MIKYLKHPKWILLLICLLFNYGCNNSNTSSSEIATQFRTALNNNVNALVSLTQLPLTVIEQEWESAKDGFGFTLGHRKTVHIEQTEDLKKFLDTLAPRVTIEGNQAISIPLNEYDNFKTEFTGSVTEWRALKTFLFKRGEGDVEHIVLLGINPSSHKVQAIYIN